MSSTAILRPIYQWGNSSSYSGAQVINLSHLLFQTVSEEVFSETQTLHGHKRAGACRPQLQDSESTYYYSYCCRLCSICSVACRSWSCLSSKSCSGVTFVLTIPQKGMPCSDASSSLGESESTINAIALSPTGNPPARIFPSDFKVLRASCPGRTACRIIPAYCCIGSKGPGSTKSMVTRYCILPASFLPPSPAGYRSTAV